MGGTNTHIALVDPAGKIIDRRHLPTNGWPTAADFVAEAATLISDITNSNRHCKVAGIGIGAPCANADTGTIEGATNLPWPSPIPLAQMMRQATGLPVAIENDANAAAMGEMAYGAARGCRNFIMLTLGTGVGAGVICDGHLLAGSRGFAGELGHITFPFASDRKCACGRNGCLQTVASASGVVATALRMLESDGATSTLSSVDASELTAHDVYTHALAGDPLAASVFDFTGRCLGQACAEFAAFTDPEAIILFGGVAQAGDMLIGPMKKALEANVLHLYRQRIQIMLSALPESDAALLGAASLPLMRQGAE